MGLTGALDLRRFIRVVPVSRVLRRRSPCRGSATEARALRAAEAEALKDWGRGRIPSLAGSGGLASPGGSSRICFAHYLNRYTKIHFSPGLELGEGEKSRRNLP